MKKRSSSELAKELFEKIHAIRLNDAAAIFGTSAKESMLQGLRKNAAELGAALGSKKPYETVMKHYEAVASEIDTAGVTGLISDAELPDYYKIIDDLWAAIERENK